MLKGFFLEFLLWRRDQRCFCSAGTQVQAPARPSGLKGLVLSHLHLRPDPWLGNSVCRGAAKNGKKAPPPPPPPPPPPRAVLRSCPTCFFLSSLGEQRGGQCPPGLPCLPTPQILSHPSLTPKPKMPPGATRTKNVDSFLLCIYKSLSPKWQPKGFPTGTNTNVNIATRGGWFSSEQDRVGVKAMHLRGKA